jgi:hypothetical protein
MKWGEAQNLLTVIIGLNVGLYALKELRMPRLLYLRHRANTLMELADNLLDQAQLRAPPDLKEDIESFHRRAVTITSTAQPMVEHYSQPWESWAFGKLAAFAGTAATILLIVSTLIYEKQLPLWLFLLITTIGFLPIVGAVLGNLCQIQQAKVYLGRDVEKLWKEWSVLNDRINAHDPP